jgi:hypothetical protein
LQPNPSSMGHPNTNLQENLIPRTSRRESSELIPRTSFSTWDDRSNEMANWQFFFF